MSRLLQTPLVLLIDIYRGFVSPLLPRSCRFQPSCSSYSREAILVHGPLRGLSLAVRRIFSCHPWNEGGWDPVAKRESTGPSTDTGE